MSTDKSFMEFLADQIKHTPVVTYRKMFGEYALYCGGKVVALVCDNRLFVKQTPGGRKFIGDVTEAPAYPGARMSFLIEDGIDDSEWLSGLIRITEKEVPKTKPKRKKRAD